MRFHLLSKSAGSTAGHSIPSVSIMYLAGSEYIPIGLRRDNIRVINFRRMASKKFNPGQHIRIKLSGGRIENATIEAIIERTDGVRLQVDFGHEQTTLIEEWQVVKD
jgi:hypothetical protein